MVDASIPVEETAPPDMRINLEERQEIMRLARRLPHRYAVRQIALSLLEGRSIEGETLEPLLRVLQMPNEMRWRERAVAAWAVGQIPLKNPEKGRIARLLGLIVTNQQLSKADRLFERGARSVTRTALFVLIASVLYGTICSISPYGLYTSGSGRIGPFLGLVLLLFCATVISCLFAPFFSFCLDDSHNNWVRRYAARSLGRLGHPLSIGELAVGALDDNAWVSCEAMGALRKVLPTLAPEQCGQHATDTVPTLCKFLFAYHVPHDIRPLIIEALGKIGDGRAVKPVEKIAKSAAGTPLSEAAERVLPILRERQQRENDPKRLVRAASAPSEPANLLLRPAQDSGSAEAHLLLRSSVPDEDG